MKIAVTAQGTEMTSEIDPRFGRAACFLVVDTESGDHQVVDKTQNLNAAQGAGVQAAQTVANLKVDAVLTGHCGPKAFQVLQSGGVAIYVGATGTVAGTGGAAATADPRIRQTVLRGDRGFPGRPCSFAGPANRIA